MWLLRQILRKKRHTKKVYPNPLLYSYAFTQTNDYDRHMEDGCSKRFDIETVDFRPPNYTPDNNPMDQFKLVLPPHPDQMGRNPSYIQNSHYSPLPHSTHAPHDAIISPLTSVSSGAPYLDRNGYMMTGPKHHNQEPVWSSWLKYYSYSYFGAKGESGIVATGRIPWA